jgi:hypothetical protein
MHGIVLHDDPVGHYTAQLASPRFTSALTIDKIQVDTSFFNIASFLA